MIDTFAIAKLELRPGDILVVKLPGQPSSQQVGRVQDYIAQHLPSGVKAMLIAEDVELQVVAQTDYRVAWAEPDGWHALANVR